MTDSPCTSGSDSGVTNVGRSAVRQLTASLAKVERSAVQRLNAQTVDATQSSVMIANATTIELKQSAALVAASDYARIEDSQVVLLLAPRVSGNVRAVLTVPGAFALGAGFFFARWLTRMALRRGSS